LFGWPTLRGALEIVYLPKALPFYAKKTEYFKGKGFEYWYQTYDELASDVYFQLGVIMPLYVNIIS
jgi:hypothetical protein